MSEVILKESQTLKFLGYPAGTEDSARHYNVGESLTVIGLEDESESPFEYFVKNEKGVESYLFSNEFKVVAEATKEEVTTEIVEPEVETQEEIIEEIIEEDDFIDDAEVVEAELVEDIIEDVIEDTIEDESPIEEVVEEPVKPTKKTKTKVQPPKETIDPVVKPKPKLEPELQTEAPAKVETQEVKKPALEGEHIKASEATNFIEKANIMISELGASGALIKLAKESAFNKYVMGGAISKIIKGNEQVEQGYDKGRAGAEQYIEDTFGIKDRMARSFETTYDVFTPMGEAVVALLLNTNATKANTIAAAIKSHELGETEAVALLDFSAKKGNGIEEVKMKIAEEFVENNDATAATTDKWMNFKLRVPNDRGDLIKSIIKQVQEENEQMSEDEAFVHIFTEYSDLVLNAS